MLSVALLLAALASAAPRTVGTNVPPAAVSPVKAAPSRIGPSDGTPAAPVLPAQLVPGTSSPGAAPAPAAVSASEQLYSIRGLEGRPPQPQQLSFAFDGSRSLRERVAALAAPWRTETQLKRLSEKPRASGETFRFNVVGDGEEGRFWVSRALFNVPGVFAQQLRDADEERADFTVQLGDMVSRGTPRRFLKFFQMLRVLRLKLPLLTIPGNHDRHRPHGLSHLRLYKALFGAADYYLDRGDWRFVFLDSSARRVTPAQLAWLDRALAAGKRAVLFTHVPPGPLSAWTDWGPFKAAGGIGEGGAELMALVAQRGVEAVFMGHIHAYDLIERDGVKYYLTGGGGSPLWPAPVAQRFHHYLHVEAGPRGLKVIVRPRLSPE